MKKIVFSISFIWAMLQINSCTEPYIPDVVASNNNYLVVDGFINSGGDSIKIKLSRTTNIGDTIRDVPELSAGVSIESGTGVSYGLTSLGNGIYGTAPIIFNPSLKYKLRISTAGGGLYESDLVDVKPTPAIDSVSWVRDSGITISVNTKDVTNNTRYYRWAYEETWEHQAFYEALYKFDYLTNLVSYRDSTEMTFQCYSNDISKDIIIGTSSNLSQDQISNQRITIIPKASEKVFFKYSILVKQYALTKEAFEYWQILKKNAKDLGSIFGNQPSKLIGNIKCISNPKEPVIGFVSISSEVRKRIFIYRADLSDWGGSSSYASQCKVQITPPDSLSYYLQNDRQLTIAYSITGGGFAMAKEICTNCTLNGGSTTKPSFW